MARGPRVPFIGFLGVVALAVGLVVLVRAAPWRDERGAPVRAGRSPPLAPPACAHGNEQAEADAYEDWAQTLVDTTYRLSRNYEPPDLVSTIEVGFPTDVPVRRVVLEELTALREAAESEGIHLDVTFGYRSFDLQRILFREWRTRRSREEVLATVARPGHSEHQLGTALDFTTAGTGPPDPGWGNSVEGAWLARHAHEFGFVESYPEGKRSVTCYRAEPWHFRYVGPELARVVANTPHTLREHLWCIGETGRPCATLGAA